MYVAMQVAKHTVLMKITYNVLRWMGEPYDLNLTSIMIIFKSNELRLQFLFFFYL